MIRNPDADDDDGVAGTPYDIIACDYAFRREATLAGSSRELNEENERYVDLRAIYDLRYHIVVVSLFLVFLLCLAMIVGSLALDRAFGFYSAANVFLVLVLFFALLVVFKTTPQRRILHAQVLFILIALCTVIGVVMSFIYSFGVRDRVAHDWCGRRERCTAEELESRKTMAQIAAILGVIVTFVVLSAYARVVFVYTVALHRFYLTPGQERSLPLYAPVTALAFLIPDYPRAYRAFRSCIQAIWRSILACFLTSCDFVCECRFCTEKCVVYSCALGCIASFFIALFICAIASGGLKRFACGMAEFLFEFFIAILSN